MIANHDLLIVVVNTGAKGFFCENARVCVKNVLAPGWKNVSLKPVLIATFIVCPVELVISLRQ